jgi:hypothetical protein
MRQFAFEVRFDLGFVVGVFLTLTHISLHPRRALWRYRC